MEKELKSLLNNVAGSLSTIAETIDKAVNHPDIEIEIPPPICPNCKTVNPQIVVAEAESRGPLGEFVLQTVCLHCRKGFFGVPMVWASFKDRDEAILMAKRNLERMKGNGSERDT